MQKLHTYIFRIFMVRKETEKISKVIESVNNAELNSFLNEKKMHFN